ncbi:MAG TPA: acetylxylan esterase [archaeon]|nr:acetylxylan esterase [archaeon]
MRRRYMFERIGFYLTALLTCALLFISEVSSFAQEDLSVLKGWRLYSDAENMLYNKIAGEAHHFLDLRAGRIAGITTKEQWLDYIAEVREKLKTAFGPLPERTPLNARITGFFEYQGIRVEKVIYESRPGFWVTGCLFKPAGLKGRAPAVLYVCGHTIDGFKSEVYQRVMLNLASKGFVVFGIDPPGQGERLQYFDPQEGKSVIGGPTIEHSYAGLQYLLLGRTMAMVRLWDGMRALDYLSTRPDVKPGQIGVQGRSGGGTMSAYLGAMDHRIAAAAPECYISSFSRILDSMGPQDAEQNLLSQISTGLDHGDFLIARAPKPTLVVTTTRDYFSIQGARETVKSVRPAFKALGAADNIQIIEDDAPHMSTKRNRERVYAFFMNNFGVKGSAEEKEIGPVDPELLKVSATGQTVTSGSKAIYDFIRQDASPALENLENSRKQINLHQEKVREASRSLSGLEIGKQAPEAVFTGRFQRDGYTIERVILDPRGEIPVPALVFVPSGGGRYPAVLYINMNGKAADADSGGLIESIVRCGYLVLATDLPGCGELAGNKNYDDAVIKGVSYNFVFGAQLIGSSVTGIQAGSIVRSLLYLTNRSDVIGQEITAVSRGAAGPALMHAAVHDNTIGALAFIESPLSWESILMHRLYDQAIGATIVPGALGYYDLPDLLGLLAPRRVLIVDPVDGNASPAPESLQEKILMLTEPFYKGDTDRISILNTNQDNPLEGILSRWLRNKLDNPAE